MPNALFIYNPAADRGRAGRRVAELRALTDTDGATWVATARPGHATELAARAGADGGATVVAVGGDGTVHEVVNGLMQVDAARRPAMGVVPLGSGNDFAFGAGVPADAEQALRRVLQGGRRRVDVASVTDGQGRREYWDNSLGIGFDAAVNIQSRRIHRLHGFAMYLTATLRSILSNFDSPHMSLTVDGRTWEQPVLMLTLGNGPREGGGFRTTPAARMDDGKLDYVVIDPVSRLTMLRVLPTVMQGTHGRFPFVRLGTFTRLHLRADRALPVHSDGELFAPYEADVRELTVAVEPGAIELVG